MYISVICEYSTRQMALAKGRSERYRPRDSEFRVVILQNFRVFASNFLFSAVVFWFAKYRDEGDTLYTKAVVQH